MIQEHGVVVDGAEALSDTVIAPDLAGWESPEEAQRATLKRTNGLERKKFRNGWEERAVAGSEYAELGITTLWTRVWFQDLAANPVVVPTIPGVHDVDGVTLVISGIHLVTWRSDCPACVRQGRGAFGPGHDAMPDCESGGRSHCTCDRCF